MFSKDKIPREKPLPFFKAEGLPPFSLDRISGLNWPLKHSGEEREKGGRSELTYMQTYIRIDARQHELTKNKGHTILWQNSTVPNDHRKLEKESKSKL